MSASITVCPTDVFLIAGQQWRSVAHRNKITGLGYTLIYFVFRLIHFFSFLNIFSIISEEAGSKC